MIVCASFENWLVGTTFGLPIGVKFPLASKLYSCPM